MTEQECLELINSGELDASDLLASKLPKVADRFRRLDKSMAKLLSDVRKEFPDATYYTSGGDGFALLLGASHSEGASMTAQQELVAEIGIHARIDGGDW